MRKEWSIYLVIILVAFISGCGDGVRSEPKTRVPLEVAPTSSVPVEVAPTSSVPVEVAPTSTVPDEVAMAVADIEKDFSTLPSVVTNWSGAVAVAHQIGQKIIKLPSGLSEQYGRKMAQSILSIPIHQMSYYARSRTLVAIFHMLTEEVGWRGMKRENLWELRIMSLTRYREEIEHVLKNEGDRRNRSYLTSVSNNLNGAILTWEVQLAFWDSKLNFPPRTLECEVVSDEEYAAIRKRFEEFLGRPIRSYEEIMRIEAERSEQTKRAMESRPTDSDVKVDLGDL